MTEPALRPRLVLAALAVLLSAASSLGAGTTSVGLLVRALIGGFAFYAIGLAAEKVLAWATELERAPLPPPVTKELSYRRGQRVDVTVPAIAPADDQ